jgi:hypothetical protein
MDAPTLTCHAERRRDKIRDEHRNGIDFVEVADARDQRELRVYFLGKVPSHLEKANVRIEGGQRIRCIEVESIAPREAAEEDRDDWLRVIVKEPGDFSTYTLRLVELQKDGRPTDKPLHGFDPRYAGAEFSFKAGCPSELDCRADSLCAPEARAEPDINYLAKDYASFRQLILDRLALIMPDWQERHVPDLGITLIELLAYVGDHLSYWQDAAGTEAYLDTARRRISVRRHARLVGYTLHEGCNARAWVCIHATSDDELAVADTRFAAGLDRPQIAGEELPNLPSGSYESFRPLVAEGVEKIKVHPAHNEIAFYTWGDALCCLPRGATSATLRDKDLHLQTHDVLIFEEIIGPRTGDAADADPTRRWAVRLAKVEPGTDPLTGDRIVEIAWAREDALPFAFCISARLAAPDCRVVHGISVARGNVVLVDHGDVAGQDETFDAVPEVEVIAKCACEGSILETTRVAGKFAPVLRRTPLTFSAPLPTKPMPASGALAQDPRAALPRIEPIAPGGWEPRRDLLASGPDDRHFVVEIDNEGGANLRFGDGECGRRPDAGATFAPPRYRIGNGPAGNVGAGAIATLVLAASQGGVTHTVRNPLPATGGTAPEPIAEAKLFAPHAFRKILRRAIVADDYARLAERDAKIQRAGAALRWTGSWYEAQVAIDPFQSGEPETKLLHAIECALHRYRRIGHDVAVRRAHYVPLEIALDVCVQPHSQRGHVEAALRELFSSRRLPGGQTGFFHPDRLTFGTSIYLSQLVAAAQNIAGVASARVVKLQRLDEGPNGEIARGVLALSPLEIAQLDSDPNFPGRGKLTLTFGGGR